MWATPRRSFRIGGGQVDLVEDRDDLQVVLHREVQVGQRLRLDALSGVDEASTAPRASRAAHS